MAFRIPSVFIFTIALFQITTGKSADAPKKLGENLIDNPSFESGLDGWSEENMRKLPVCHRIQLDSSTTNDGKSSCKLTVDSSLADKKDINIYPHVFVTKVTELEAGKTYRYSFDYKGDPEKGKLLSILILPIPEPDNYNLFSYEAPPGNGWQTFAVTFKVERAGKAEFGAGTMDAPGQSFWFDNFKLQEVLFSHSNLHGVEQLHIPQARLHLMKTPPTIDGVVHDDEWSGAARMERFAGADGQLSPQEASFWVGCDGKELFVAVVSETPPDGKILSRVPPLPEDGDARTWSDDSIELVLDPLRADTSGRRRLYHANLNALGAINDTAYTLSGGGEAWRGHWRTASKVVGNRWHFEAALPLKDMNVTEADLAKPFGIRVVRNWQQHAAGPPQTEWSPLGGAYLNPDTLPVVSWDAHAPIVEVLQLHDPDKLMFRARVAIRNPNAKPLEVQATVKCVPKDSAATIENRTVKIPPGEVTVLDVPAATLPHDDLYGLIQITSSDGATVYYLRDFRWKLERPDPLWVFDEEAAKKAAVGFAYYPYHDTIKAVINVNGLKEREKVIGVKLSVRAKGDMKPLTTAQMPALQKFLSEMEWKIPPLKEGSYEFVVEPDGVKVRPMVTDFVRHVMPWEHNKLGKSDVIVEPFEPIGVKGQQVSTVSRRHTLNNLGLWDQVESVGRPLLKAPMWLEVNAARAAGSKLRFVEKNPTRVVAESRLTADKFAGTTRSEWDYDGMMKWTLEIQPSKETIDSMTLVIPLDDKAMPLFHACTDGLRFNYAGATPAGQGRVWDGAKAARNSIIGSYVPYIWLGAEERGLAVFGENDRGWARDPKVPCQELVRNGETLELRLNLIARDPEGDAPSSPRTEKGADGATPRLPSSLPLAPSGKNQSRRIVIGFQATPTKPMPPGWRSWNVNLDHHPEIRAASTRGTAFLGCGYQWGALTGYDDIYPRDEDFTVYDKFAEARRTGNVDREWLKKWMADTRLPDGADRSSFEGNLECGFRACASQPRNIIVYTNPRALRHDTREGQTFLDEWHVDAFLSRKATYGGGSTYGCNPVESFRDYAMWYYHKMLETFVEDIYWDNIYLKACFDTVGTDAYELSPGTIQPSVGLWNMRELIRRTAILDHEMKKRPMNMVHSTNTGIAPIMAFSHSHLTMEDRQGDSDFQDRFSRDYLRAESIGLQHGSVPFALELVQGPDEKKNAWARRTAAGVMLTHEIKSIMNSDLYRSCFRLLLQFGYGKPDVRVFNYWQPNNPVRVEGADVATLVMSKPGSAMIVACDYANGGNLTLTLDAKSLGLKSGFAAKDAETGEALPVTDGKVTFALKKHDFRMVVLE
ncbi:MAG: hypothetical protein HY360_09945 [Verrucomicrobia bacterium]|nr:hypothetical protein [Verrucomicrobiota bacterium]